MERNEQQIEKYKSNMKKIETENKVTLTSPNVCNLKFLDARMFKLKKKLKYSSIRIIQHVQTTTGLQTKS